MTDRYAVIGSPIRQSKSPLIHSSFARSTGEDLVYEALEAGVAGFAAAADAFRHAGGRGLNITAPLKLEAFRYATDVHGRAREAGAVNCLKFAADRILAENFDGVGLRRDLEGNLGVALRGRRVLLLGAGGAARGALGPLLDAGAGTIVIANRNAERAEALWAETGGGFDAVGLSALSSAGSFDVVLNATSSSLHGQAVAVPGEVFAAGGVAYDLSYGKGLTPFLRLAQRHGVRRLHDGVGMLVEQAAEAFAWWRGVRPDTRAVIGQLTMTLA